MNPLGQHCQKVFVNLRTEQKNPLRVNYQNSNKKIVLRGALSQSE